MHKLKTKRAQAALAAIPELRSFANAILGPVGCVDNLIHGSIVDCWGSPETNTFRFHLFRSLVSAIREYLGRETNNEGTVPSASEKGTSISDVLSDLPYEQREAFTLVGLAGFSVSEAAALTGHSVTEMDRLAKEGARLAYMAWRRVIH
ncbi:hypothetical protein [Rhizobium mesosinicum]|uniref:RNA polymerase sigma factor 70 region 4 type 2 domain-containing protein n=1 Tax=Rhizobium mesosinicum TaxID=335017 RepID=A0ABS7GM95_9HYPH|nr:hypothetical protein [Rhizobium mesosinicum]MBW9051096.1 hypothetical protein [Rhizobium mesosinicum]